MYRPQHGSTDCCIYIITANLQLKVLYVTFEGIYWQNIRILTMFSIIYNHVKIRIACFCYLRMSLLYLQAPCFYNYHQMSQWSLSQLARYFLVSNRKISWYNLKTLSLKDFKRRICTTNFCLITSLVFSLQVWLQASQFFMVYQIWQTLKSKKKKNLLFWHCWARYWWTGEIQNTKHLKKSIMTSFEL